MVKALARAFRWRKMLDEGVHATLEDLARAKGVHAAYVSRVLRLTLLAPEIVEAILDRGKPAELQLHDLWMFFAPPEGPVQPPGAITAPSGLIATAKTMPTLPGPRGRRMVRRSRPSSSAQTLTVRSSDR